MSISIKHKQKKSYFFAFTTLFVLMMLLQVGTTGCYVEPEVKITIINQTDHILHTPYHGHGNDYEVQPENSITLIYGYQSKSKYVISFENDRGEMVFEREYSYDELKNIDFRITIATSENSTISKENISSK